MKVETSNFIFFTLDKNNPIHLNFLKSITNDELIAKYLGNMKNYFEDITFDSLDFSNHYLAVLDNKIVGFISLFAYLEYASLNLALKSEYRGIKLVKDNSIGTMMIKEFTDEMFKQMLTLKYFEGMIDKSNISSQKIALKAGFTHYKDNSHFNNMDEYRKYKVR